MPTSSAALKSVVSLSKNSRNTSLSRSTCGTSDESTPVDKSIFGGASTSISIGIGVAGDISVADVDTAAAVTSVCDGAEGGVGGGSCCSSAVTVVVVVDDGVAVAVADAETVTALVID